MQPLGDMTFYHVIMWQIKNIISTFTKTAITRLSWNNMRTKWYHCYMTQGLLYDIYYIPLPHSFMSYMSFDHINY